MNIVSVDQYLNLFASAVLLGLALTSLLKSRGRKLHALLISCIAIFNVCFYAIAITTSLNEAYRYEYAAISGARSFVTILTLCGVGVNVLRSKL
jgi:hypothetical protein